MASPLDIAQIVKVISVAFPNWKVTEETNEVYYQFLSDISTDELKVAVKHIITEAGRAFAPSVGEIRGAVTELRGMSANVPSSFEAWQLVQRQIVETGSYRTPVFDSPVVAKAVEAMGWRNLCLSEDQTADRARFIQCYEQFKQRAEVESTMLPEVRGYLQENGAKLFSPMEQIHRLSDGMRK